MKALSTALGITHPGSVAFLPLPLPFLWRGQVGTRGPEHIGKCQGGTSLWSWSPSPYLCFWEWRKVCFQVPHVPKFLHQNTCPRACGV